MRSIRRGERGPAVTEIRSILVALGLMAPADDPGEADAFDISTERAVRAFQQERGLDIDGQVGDETWRSLDSARWSLGARTLYFSVNNPLHGDDVRQLQERLLEMGYDAGRTDGVYGARTEKAVAAFQREMGLTPDGGCGPQTLHALRRLGRKVVGGSPQKLREESKFRQQGPSLVGRQIVIDAGHGGQDLGIVVPDGPLRWTEADLAFDLAARLEGRLAAAGMRVHLTRGPFSHEAPSDLDRAQLANDLGADLLISIHIDGHANPEANGVAAYHYGTETGVTSTMGERLAGLVLREIVARTGMRNCWTHAKSWDLLRYTRMPAVRVDVGYLTSPEDRKQLIDPLFREQVVEAIVAAVQRIYLPQEIDVKTGLLDVSEIRMALAQ